MYAMFIDDERFPANDGRNWKICRTFKEAVNVIAEFGYPNYISFDHDLGDNEPTGFDFAKWLVDRDIESDHRIIPDFYVHSQNPIGAENIRSYLNSYFRHRDYI